MDGIIQSSEVVMTAEEMIQKLQEVPADTELVVFKGGYSYRIEKEVVTLIDDPMLYDDPVIEIGLGWG